MSMDVVAVVTASGKAYYRIISELNRRGISSLSLIPGVPVPLNVKVAITTRSEREKVNCSSVLVYDEFPDSSLLIDRALQIIQGKIKYAEVVVGIDPGKRFGIAALGDGRVLKILTASNVKEAVASVTKIIEKTDGEKKIVRIGDGAKNYQSRLVTLLDEVLPSNVLMESVKENGTTKLLEKPSTWRTNLRDGVSATKISTRKGRPIVRGR